MPRTRFGVPDEEIPISVAHAQALAAAAYGFLKDENSQAAEKVLGILIGYLRGNGEVAGA